MKNSSTCTISLPFTHNVVKCIHWFALQHSFCLHWVILVHSSLHTFHKLFEISEPLKKRFVGQKLYIFVVVEGPVGCAALVHLFEVVWFMGIDPLQDA